MNCWFLCLFINPHVCLSMCMVVNQKMNTHTHTQKTLRQIKHTNKKNSDYIAHRKYIKKLTKTKNIQNKNHHHQQWHTPGAVDVDEGADLGGGEGDVFITNHDLQLLPPHPVRLRPWRVVLLHDLRVINDPLQLLHHAAVAVGLKAEKWWIAGGKWWITGGGDYMLYEICLIILFKASFFSYFGVGGWWD